MVGALYFLFLSANFLFSDVDGSAYKFFFISFIEKKVVLECLYLSFNRPRRFCIYFKFLLCLKVFLFALKNYFRRHFLEG
jgi:hypothetical protein